MIVKSSTEHRTEIIIDAGAQRLIMLFLLGEVVAFRIIIPRGEVKGYIHHTGPRRPTGWTDCQEVLRRTEFDRLLRSAIRSTALA